MSDEKIIVKVDPDLEDLVPGFLENRSLDIENLRSELNKSDFEQITSIGHNLKGVGGGYGFEFMSELGANIETAGKESNADAIQENINKLDNYLKCIEVEYT